MTAIAIQSSGTSIPLVYDKELKFYIEFFLGVELLKNTRSFDLHFDLLRQKFDDFYFESKIPFYTKYQFINAIKAIDKYTIKVHKVFDLYKISKTDC